MPKVELHVHLEGATDAETVWEMARRNRVTLPAATLEDWRSFYRFRDFDHFIEVYELACEVMRTPDDWAFMIERFLETQARQKICYSEAFFSVCQHLGKFSAEDWLDAFEAGVAAGERRTGSRVRFIADLTRHAPESRWQALEFALRGKERGLVIALGLGGKERGHPPEAFADVYAEARTQGLHLVAHAGETDGPASVRGALRALGVERIGHGVRSLEDAALIEELRARRIPLEVSPTSNYCLGVTPRGVPHPIRQLVDAGVLVTLNSDDPPMFGTDLVGEYHLLAEQGFTWEELWQLNLNALEASFLDPDEKAHLARAWTQEAVPS